MTATIARPVDHASTGAHRTPVDGSVSTSPATIDLATPNASPSLADHSSRDDQTSSDTQGWTVVTGAASPATNGVPAQPKGMSSLANHSADQPATKQEPTPSDAAPLADPFLALAADVLDDVERTKIANENRLRQLTRGVEDSDGETRGFGLDESHPDVARLAALVEMLGKVEHDATLNLQRMVRRHPLGPWIKATVGVGEKQGARLIATIGDPYLNLTTGQPRTVSQLWAYCGLHVLPVDHLSPGAHGTNVDGAPTSDPGPSRSDDHAQRAGVAARRRKGVKANWSSDAKMRAYLVAVSCIKALESPYRAVYVARRAHTAEKVHAVTCPQCGPAGKPAQPGSPWSPGPQHADALRIVSKAILRDLWREARRLHGAPSP